MGAKALQRSLIALVFGMALALFSLVTLGLPDWNGVGNFLSGNMITIGTEIEVVVMIMWVVVLGVIIMTIFQAAKRVSETEFAQRRWGRAIMYLVTGIIIFVFGLVHHIDVGYSVCCVTNTAHSVQEVTTLVQR